MAFATPPASTAVDTSATPTGASFAPVIVIVSVVEDVAPAVSLTVYVKLSFTVCAVVLSACTVVFVLSTT